MIISSKKYACETCIKGHRSSACKHTDRPLFEIKKKGRPITQCEHCRELRKTKQVHVKCICESRFDSTQQGPKAGFESAAFPDGLPPALGTSVAFPKSADGASSDSDHGGVLHSRKCKSGDHCNCITPRIRSHPSVGPSDPARGSSRRINEESGLLSKGSTSSQILARIQELRPLVPRPPTQSSGGPPHNPSMAIPHGHSSSRHHDNFTPYGRVHGMPAHSAVQPQSYMPPTGPSLSTFPYNAQTYNTQFQTMGSWGPGLDSTGLDDLSLPSLCGCGDDCSCPGCIHHNRTVAIPSSSAYASCNNPNYCGTCMDCTIMSLPSSAILPPNTALSTYNPEAIDDWLRQMSASNFDQNASFQQSFPDFQQGWANRGYTYPDNPSPNSRTGMSFPNYGGYSPNGNSSIPFDHLDSRSNRDGFPSHQRQRSHTSMPINDQHIDPRLLPRSSTSGGGGMASNRAFLTVPGLDTSRSRSPSISSQSSHHNQGSDGGNGSGPISPYRPSGRVQGMFDGAHPGRSAPQLNMNLRAGMVRGPSSGSASSSSISPSPGAGGSAGPTSGGGRSTYNNDSAGASGGNSDGSSSEYGASLAGLHIY